MPFWFNWPWRHNDYGTRSRDAWCANTFDQNTLNFSPIAAGGAETAATLEKQKSRRTGVSAPSEGPVLFVVLDDVVRLRLLLPVPAPRYVLKKLTFNTRNWKLARWEDFAIDFLSFSFDRSFFCIYHLVVFFLPYLPFHPLFCPSITTFPHQLFREPCPSPSPSTPYLVSGLCRCQLFQTLCARRIKLLMDLFLSRYRVPKRSTVINCSARVSGMFARRLPFPTYPSPRFSSSSSRARYHLGRVLNYRPIDGSPRQLSLEPNTINHSFPGVSFFGYVTAYTFEPPLKYLWPVLVASSSGTHRDTSIFNAREFQSTRIRVSIFIIHSSQCIEAFFHRSFFFLSFFFEQIIRRCCVELVSGFCSVLFTRDVRINCSTTNFHPLLATSCFSENRFNGGSFICLWDSKLLSIRYFQQSND